MNIKGKKIVITGASGFVGSNAVHYFQKLGARVTAVVSPKATEQIINRQLGEVKGKIKIKKLDLLSPTEALIATKEQDIVLHFAAIDGNAEFKKKHSAEIFSKNIRMSLNVLEASVTNSIKSFLLMSSADIYSSSKDSLITENSPIDIAWNKNIDGYKLSKWAGELAAKEFGEQYGLKIIIIRPSNLYGPRDEFINSKRMRVIPSIINKIFATKQPLVLWGTKRQKKSFLYIHDFLLICEKLLEKNVFGYPITIASKNAVSLEELAKTIVKLSNKKREITFEQHKNIGNSTKNFNLSRLHNIIPPFQETEFKEGLKETIDYFLNKIMK